MKEKIQEIQKSALAEISSAADGDAVEKLRIKYLGRKGLITELFKKMGEVSAQEKGRTGQAINSLKETVVQLVILP